MISEQEYLINLREGAKRLEEYQNRIRYRRIELIGPRAEKVNQFSLMTYPATNIGLTGSIPLSSTNNLSSHEYDELYEFRLYI